jgi:uncharacterized protein YkwD
LIGSHGAQRASRNPLRRFVRHAVFAGGIAALGIVAPIGQASTADAITTVDRPWYTVEQYYLGLANCTRTGGYGSGRYSAYVRPLRYSSSISDRDSRPYAKLLAVRALCTHYANGDPGYRLRRIGLYHSTWGENIGCRDGYSTAKAAVLASHLAMQAERSTNGGHWRNLKNRNYIWVGIGVWRYYSRTRLVTDFYG